MNSLRVELHCHTIYSHDGHIRFETLLATALGRVDLVCITDHDTIEGAQEFQRRAAARNCDLQIVIGEERTLSDGSHLIGLFLKESIFSDSFEAAIAEIREQKGICVLPHPYRRKDGILRETIRPLDGVSAFEIFNPKCSFEENKRGEFLSERGLLAIGGSDAHYASDLGQCVNLIPSVGSPTVSLARFFQIQTSYSVMGISQKPGDQGRRYAPLYYRFKPYVHVPKPLVPAARALYGFYRNRAAKAKTTQLETKYVRER